jgi:hypothetical protein
MSPDEAIAEDVAKYGRSIITISDIEPPFVYTVGLMFTYNHPELILFGQRETGADIVRGMVELIAEGRRFDAPGEYDGVLMKGNIATRRVHPMQHEFCFGFAMGYCTSRGRCGQLEAIQVFWPDRQGRFPFNGDCDEGVWARQPRLDQVLGPMELRERRAQLGTP